MRRDVDAAVTALAVRQHGVFRVNQALAVGATPQLIQRRVASGAWIRRSLRVLALAGALRTWRQHVLAAVFEAGDGAVASHRSAAVLLAVPGFEEGWPETQRPGGGGHRVTLSTLHETFWLPPGHRTVVDGIPCTSLARTIFDLASCVHPLKVERALDNSLARGGLDIGRMAEVLGSLGRSGKAGTTLMRDLLRARTKGYVPPESELEALFLAVIASRGIPEPVRQANVGDQEWVGRMDFLFRPWKVIVEADGRPYHIALRDRERDEARRARLEAEGWQIVVVTWRQLTHEPEQVARRIRNALRRAGASAA